jgi:predicted nucleotidyltransferase
MGSQCYGVSTESSDWDMVGWCVPPKDVVFPHLAGVIQGFGRQVQKFICYQQHHVNVPEHGREYDLNCYNIVHYFRLCMDNNPNMIDSLFVPRECIVHTSIIGEMVRERRRLFLHKGAWHKFKGYAYSQLHKMSKNLSASERKS